MKRGHPSTASKPGNAEEKLDKSLQDSFPTSDPLSYAPGIVGAPDDVRFRAKGRKIRHSRTEPSGH